MMLSVVFTTVSCGLTNENDESIGDTLQSTEDVTESAYGKLEKKQYNRTFSILTRTDMVEQFKVEEITGDLLDDAIYERNTAVASDFGITFEYTDMDYNQVNNEMKLQASGNLDDYDLYTGHKFSFKDCAQNNYCYDLATITTLDLTQAWWDQNCRENLTIDGKTYLMTGDIDPASMLISSCFVFNKKMMSELGKSVDELNALTRNGEWTLDVMYEYGKDVTRDLNGDGKIEYSSDCYNLTSWMMDVPYSLYYGAGGNFVTIVDGTPELTYTAEQVTGIYEKIYKIIVEQNAYYVTNEANYPTTYEVFHSGRALFCDITLSKITAFVSDMADPYGILPVPKYDTNQQEYLSFVNGATPFVMVGKTESDPEFVGTILEAMATFNYDRVTPKLFQVATKLQAAQDPESSAMVDYIVRNRIWDLGYFADWNITNQVRLNLEKGKAEIAGDLASQEKATKRGLSNLLRAYSKHQ
jgi:hypothetical protein